MKKFGLFLALTLGLLCNITAQQLDKETHQKPLQTVGMDIRKFIDPKRQNWNGIGQKTVTTFLWYPSNGNSTKLIFGGNTDSIPVVSKGPLANSPEKYPLILLSHGAGGKATDLAMWAYYLASRGFIVACVQHRGDSTEQAEMNFLSLSDLQMWQRPQDISAVLTALLADSLYSSRIDTTKIAAGGFSLGGYTAIAVAGARLDLSYLQANTNIDNQPPSVRNSVKQYTELLAKNSLLQASLAHSGDSYKDDRIKGVFALAPAIGQAFTKEGLADIAVPVHIAVGEKDLVAPKELNAALYASGIKNAVLTILPGEAGHITRPDKTAIENWQKVYELSYEFFEAL